MSNVVSLTVRANDETRGFAGVKAGLERALGGMKGIAVAAGADMATSLAGPVVAAAGTAVAAFASAGAALGAFGAAAAPQLGKVTEASELYAKAQKSAADGSKSAAKDMEAYKKALAAMPPATRATAVAFSGLKDDFKKWSDALAPKTMPIFTKGIEVLRSVLPSLTPLVDAGADALSGFMDSMKKGVDGGGPARFFSKLADASRQTLPALLNSLKNVAVGVGGVISAFLPFSGSFAGGLEKMTKRFADFGQQLGQNKGFQAWMAEMQSRGPGILELLGNLIKIVANVAQALAPFSGLTLAVAEALAKLVASIPQGVMDWLAPAIAGIVLGLKAWAVVQGILNIALAANPIGIVVLAIAALVAGLIYAYKHSEKFRDAVDRAWSAVQGAVSAAWGVIQPILSELVSWFTGSAVPAVSDFASEVGTSFGKIKDTVTSAFGDAKKVLEEFVGFLDTNVSTAISDLVKGVDSIGGSVKGLPDQLSGLKGLGGGGDKDKEGKGAGSSALSAISKPFAKLADTIKKIMSGLFKWIEGHWDDALDGIAKIVGTWGKAMQTLWSKPWNWMIKFAAQFWALITGMALAGVKRIGHAILSPWPGIQKQWDNHMRGLPTAAARMVSSVIQAVGRLPGRIAGIASRMWSSIPRSLSGAVGAVQNMLNSLSGWVGSKLASMASSVRSAVSSVVGAIPGFAHGGIVGAAGGGPRSNLVMVGEQGPELVRLPFGSTVIPNGQTERMTAAPTARTATTSKPKAKKSTIQQIGHIALSGLMHAVEGKIAALKKKMSEITSAVRKEFDGHKEDVLVAYVRKQTDKLEALAGKRDAIAKKLADAKKFAADTAKNLAGFASLSGLGATDVRGIRNGLADRLDKMKAFARALGQLKAKKVATSLIQQVISEGPEGGLQLAQILLSGDSGTLKAINSMTSQIGKTASSIGNAAADAMFDTKKLRKSLDSMQDQMDKIADRFGMKIRKAFHIKGGGSDVITRILKGHAAGGPGGGWATVGEHGRELVRLPYGSSVVPNGQTEAMLRGGGGSGRVVLELNSAGSRMDDLLIEILSHAVGARGGDVQVVLGRSR